MTRRPLQTCALLLLVAALACASSQQADQAGEAMVKGALVGAMGGLLIGGMFGTSLGTSAAIGAGVGAAGGAAYGASQSPRSEPLGPTVPGDPPEVLREQRRRLRAELGPSAYAGLEALAECRHDDALTWAQNAAYTDNADHALAGVWLEAVTYGDAGRIEEARAMLPRLVERDPRVESVDVAERLVDQRVVQLRDIRVSYGEPATCS
ncbi:MAG: hypothetical protein QNK04_09820 [Myxococcota bacterium]|nr:hypothetical protein [Myxococcota bacterium]